MTTHLTPLEVAKQLLGGYEVIAGICGVDQKTPYHWRKPAHVREAGDIPHTLYQRRLLEHSIKHKLGLTSDHLICGASAADVRSILTARTQSAKAAA